jgi:hypothetical protein
MKGPLTLLILIISVYFLSNCTPEIETPQFSRQVSFKAGMDEFDLTILRVSDIIFLSPDQEEVQNASVEIRVNDSLVLDTVLNGLNYKEIKVDREELDIDLTIYEKRAEGRKDYAEANLYIDNKKYPSFFILLRINYTQKTNSNDIYFNGDGPIYAVIEHHVNPFDSDNDYFYTIFDGWAYYTESDSTVYFDDKRLPFKGLENETMTWSCSMTNGAQRRNASIDLEEMYQYFPNLENDTLIHPVSNNYFSYEIEGYWVY